MAYYEKYQKQKGISPFYSRYSTIFPFLSPTEFTLEKKYL
jgi:hypothetical protein